MGWKHWDEGKFIAPLLKTGQVTSYHAGDDGDLQLGIAPSFAVLTTGRYSGTVNIIVNGKTHATSNACVQANSGLMFHREVIQTDLGPANDGKFFWEQWTLAAESCTFATAADTITAAAGTPFDTGALCVGRKITISGTTNNNGVVTVTNITTTVITVSENLTDEGPVNTTFVTKDDLIWDLKDQVNSGSGIAGYTDWRFPNRRELESIVDLEHCSPAINGTIFPSTPSSYHWTASTNSCSSANAWDVNFVNGNVYDHGKRTSKFYVRLVR